MSELELLGDLYLIRATDRMEDGFLFICLMIQGVLFPHGSTCVNNVFRDWMGSSRLSMCIFSVDELVILDHRFEKLKVFN